MPFLHDLAEIAATILAVFWAFGVRWGWRYLANGVLRHPALRGPAALLFWWFFWGIARFISVQAALLAVGVAALAMHPGPVLADLVARQGDDSVRLTDAPCTSEKVLAHLGADQHEEFHAASAMFQGQGFAACWRVMGNVAFLIYEDGDQGVIPISELKPALGA